VDPNDIYAVVIVGAGPAGTAAAKIIKEAGYSLLLIDKAQFPRNKPCAGVLPPRIYSEVEIPIEIHERELNGYRLFGPSGEMVESAFTKSGLIVNRTRFDEFLLKRLDHPVEKMQISGLVNHNDNIEVTGKTKSYRAKIVVGADGVNSIIRKATGLSSGTIAMAAQYEVILPKAEIDNRIGNWFEVYYTIPFGYGWLSPLRDSIKVGVGGISEELKKNPKQFLNNFIGNPVVKKKIGDGKVENFELHRIPMSGPVSQLTNERVILVGDAGGFVYPGTGEGIYYAIKSGRLAGEVIIQALEEQRFDQPFLEQLYNEKLEANGLFSLREVNFIEEVLSSTENTERYIRKLQKLSNL
jgi:geranylgeranyl reductase family protein